MTDTPPLADGTVTGDSGALRIWASRQRRRLWLYVIVLPMLGVAVYSLFVATERYQSEARFVVKRSDASSPLGGLNIPLLGGTAGAGTEDALHLREFILSADLADRLDRALGLKAEFSRSQLDILNNLPPWARREDFLRLYRDRVTVDFDDKSGVLVLTVLASSPALARRWNQAILAEAETFINEMSHNISREQVAFAQGEVDRVRKSLEAAREELLAFQNRSGMLDPVGSAEVGNRVIAELKAQLTAREVELESMAAMYQPDAPQVLAVRQAIAGLRRQIVVEQQKLTAAEGSGLNRTAARFADRKASVEFQTDLYKVALASLEKVRLEAARKVRSLAVLSSPQLPERVLYPRRVYLLAAWLFGLVLLHGLVRLAIEIVEDHRD